MARLKRSINRSELRGGYTTGACAAAVARAAVRMLMTNKSFTHIEIQIPNGEWVTFELVRLDVDDSGVTAGVIKDAGDDPDCTHGIEIQCQARWMKSDGIAIKGGVGVATVTLPGLELGVGEPAINPVPRANIVAMVEAELDSGSIPPGERGVEVMICAPQGELVAKETINERLGLIGGISILGTRGTVKPYSTSAFAASVRQSVQIAAANGLEAVVLTTGSRTEKAASELKPELSAMALIQAGDFIGIGLRAAKRYGLKRVSLVVMIGKMGKLISGRMMTHVSGHAIDFVRLSHLAREEGLSVSLCHDIEAANTGRHVLELVRHGSSHNFLTRLCFETHRHACRYTNDAIEVEVQLTDFDGSPLARYPAVNHLTTKIMNQQADN